ncbi:MAG: hypothetical protein K1T65_01635 [Candidatus Aramenus sp.]|nr:hypothetical protein [Candidatus Aramenus sp.]
MKVTIEIDIDRVEKAVLVEVEERGLSRFVELNPQLVKNVYNAVKFLSARNCVVVVPSNFYEEHEEELKRVEEELSCKVLKSYKEKKVLVFY